MGSKVQGSGFTLLGRAVNQDLRYGGAVVSALLGLVLFARVAAAAGPTICLVGGLICTAFTVYIPLAEDLAVGVSVLGLLVVVPLFLASGLLRNG